MKNKIFLTLIGFLMVTATASAATLEDVENSFYPYRNGVPKVDGITPGMTINASNWQAAKDVLDEAFLGYVKNGDYEIKIGETVSFNMHPSYVEATKENLNKARLGDNLGEIFGAEAGRPFPEEPSLDDPKAGQKLAWNFKYTYGSGDNATISPFYWKYRNMKTNDVERTLVFTFNFLNFTRRTLHEPVPEITPNPSDIFRGTYVLVHEPFDVKNTQLLLHRFQDDTKRDNAYLYLGFQRRVRRLSSGQVTDAFLGSDIMIEDFEGYNGRISDMEWTFKGTKVMLMPFYNHNEQNLDPETHKDDENYKVVSFTGKGGCYPDVTWQLRKVYVVESTPRDENHPVSKRVHYIDAQTFTIPRTSVYDRKGDLWKSFTIGYTHPDHHLPINKGSGTALYDAFSMIDVQAQHCTTGQFKTVVDPSLSQPQIFTVQNMRSRGR